MNYRRATLEDLPQLLDLIEAYCHEMTELFDEPDQQATLKSAVILALNEKPVTMAVSEAYKKLTGFAAWTKFVTSAEGEASAIGTYVIPEYRRDGVSRTLREYAKDFCKEAGAKIVTGTCLTRNYAGYKSAVASGAQVVGYVIRWKL